MLLLYKSTYVIVQRRLFVLIGQLLTDGLELLSENRKWPHRCSIRGIKHTTCWNSRDASLFRLVLITRCCFFSLTPCGVTEIAVSLLHNNIFEHVIFDKYFKKLKITDCTFNSALRHVVQLRNRLCTTYRMSD